MRLILFDCDGTMVDSAAIIHDCMTRTFEEAGLPGPAAEDTRGIIGLSLDVAMTRIGGVADGADIGRLVARYRHHFLARRSEPDFEERLFPGIDGLIAELAVRDDILIGMVTGKSRRGVASVLATHGYQNWFCTVRTADDCPSKPHPAMVLECCGETGIDPADAIVVGDTVFDIEMAKAAGAAAVGVRWGYHPAERLVEAGADIVIDRAEDLLLHLEKDAARA